MQDQPGDYVQAWLLEQALAFQGKGKSLSRNKKFALTITGRIWDKLFGKPYTDTSAKKPKQRAGKFRKKALTEVLTESELNEANGNKFSLAAYGETKSGQDQ